MADFSEQVTKPTTPAFAGRSADSEFRAVVIAGTDQGRVVNLDGTLPPRIYVGQSPACDVQLSDPRVSRRHAAIDLSGAHLVLSDLDSRNGTFVNGVAIIQARLSGGEIVKLGDTALKIERVEMAKSVPSSTADRFGSVVGASIEMRRLYTVVARLAQSSAPVLIEGEAGTGKDLVAETLHEMGPRANEPFLVVDVANTPDIEVSVFGPSGVYAEASGGTIVLDELGLLSYAAQTALAAALKRPPANAARIVATSRGDLDREVQAGRFRDDVLQAFDTGRVELPPLRRRDGDVRYLAHHLWAKLGGAAEAFPFDLLEMLASHSWPGNVAELERTLAQRIATRGEGDAPRMPTAEPQPATKDAFIAETLALDLPLVRARERVVQEFERQYLERALIKQNGNVLRAAAASGVARRYFQILRAKRLR